MRKTQRAGVVCADDDRGLGPDQRGCIEAFARPWEVLVADRVGEAAAVKAEHGRTGKPARRVVGKAGHLAKDANPRFVVTSLVGDTVKAGSRPGGSTTSLTVPRGEKREPDQGRIKECQFDLIADRTSAAMMRANPLRLRFASLACVVVDCGDETRTPRRKTLYESYGFQLLKSNPLRLFLPVGAVRTLIVDR